MKQKKPLKSWKYRFSITYIYHSEYPIHLSVFEKIKKVMELWGKESRIEESQEEISDEDYERFITSP